jgi:hypothetical protein
MNSGINGLVSAAGIGAVVVCLAFMPSTAVLLGEFLQHKELRRRRDDLGHPSINATKPAITEASNSYLPRKMSGNRSTALRLVASSTWV